MNWLDRLNGDSLSWLLEPDPANPGVRYLALTELLHRPTDAPDVCDARAGVMASGPVPEILAHQEPEGYWVKPGPGYAPKYQSTVWSITFLAQLGADGNHPQVRLGCNYLLDHARSPLGGFTATLTPAGMAHCLQGNLGAALIDLGWFGDPRLDEALDWLARSITGEGIAPAEQVNAPVRYYSTGNSAPGFACGANNKAPCAWGAVKAMLALSKVPASARTRRIEEAIGVGIGFLLGRDPVIADYPCGWTEKPSGSWFKLGFPVAYVTDVLQNLEALTGLGCGGDERLVPALNWLLGKQDAQGRWKLEYSYDDKMWVNIEQKRQPSKWVTLRALRVLSRCT